MMQVWFCWTHKVANFPSSTVLPAAYVGVGSRFAIITAGSWQGTRRAEKFECEDFLSPRAKSVTLISKPVKPLFYRQHIWFPAPAGACSPHRFRLGSFCVFKGFQTTPPVPRPPSTLAESHSQGWSAADHMWSLSMKVLTLYSSCLLSQSFPARLKIRSAPFVRLLQDPRIEFFNALLDLMGSYWDGEIISSKSPQICCHGARSIVIQGQS